MMRSLSSAVAGLRSHQTRMDVIGNNIANVNTFGFKSARVTFNDVFYQTLSRGSRPTGLSGGTNPTQIGYGAAVASIDLLMSQSGMASTGRALDVYINGEGMIPVRDANNNLFFTRQGVLGFDAAGNLVDSNGNFVMGFPIDPATGQPIINPDGSVNIDDLSRITVAPDMLDRMVGISIAPNGEIVGMMPGDVEVTMNQAAPPWIRNIIVPADSNLVGNIMVELNIYKSVPSPDPEDDSLLAAWVRSVRATDHTTGNFRFEFDPNTQRIIAFGTDAGGNPVTYSGQYRRGASVQLTRDSGDERGRIGFVVDTDFTLQPNRGTANEMMGSKTFVTQQSLTVSGTDAGGNRLTQTIRLPFDPYEAESGEFQDEITFDAVGVTLVIDATLDERLSYPRSFRELSFDVGPTHPFNAWLRGVTFVDNDEINFADGATNLSLQLVATGRQATGLTTLFNSFPNVFNEQAVSDLIRDFDNPPVDFGAAQIRFREVGTNQFQMVVYSRVGGDGPFAPHPGLVSNTFTPGPGAQITINGVTVTQPGGMTTGAAGTNLERATASFSVNPVGEIVVFDNGVEIGREEWSAGGSISIPVGADGRVTISVNQAELRGALRELSTVVNPPAGSPGHVPGIPPARIPNPPSGSPGHVPGTPPANIPNPPSGSPGHVPGTPPPVTIPNPPAGQPGHDTGFPAGDPIPNPPSGSPGHVPGTPPPTTIPNPPSGSPGHDPGTPPSMIDNPAPGVPGHVPGTPPDRIPAPSLPVDGTEADVGAMEPQVVSNWPWAGAAANAQAGITEALTIGVLALGKVPNVAAMEQMGTSYFATSVNSGEAQFFRPGMGQTGTIRAGFLEMSNVDIAQEFTDMIVTQRGFQANTRIISVSDEMLQELVNLRR